MVRHRPEIAGPVPLAAEDWKPLYPVQPIGKSQAPILHNKIIIQTHAWKISERRTKIASASGGCALGEKGGGVDAQHWPLLPPANKRLEKTEIVMLSLSYKTHVELPSTAIDALLSRLFSTPGGSPPEESATTTAQHEFRMLSWPSLGSAPDLLHR